MKIYHSFSSEETKLLGGKLAKQALEVGRKKLDVKKGALVSRRGLTPAFVKTMAGRRDKCALILALKGDLGAGKTTFTQGFLKGLGVKGRVNSPTFVLIKRYKLKTKTYKLAFHIDCYRVKKSAGLSSLGLKEIFSNPKNIVLVEWPERLGRILPRGVWKVNFKHKKENERTVVFPASFHIK